MRTSAKIKGILAIADITFAEFGKLCGLSRQTIYTYLSTTAYIEDFEPGLKAIDVSNKLMELCNIGALPLSRRVPKDQKVEKIKALLTP